MTKLEKFKRFLLDQGLFEREVKEIIQDYHIEENIDKESFDFNTFTIVGIQNAVDFGENYLTEKTNDNYILSFINYSEFGKFVAEEDDLCTYCSCSDRVIIWEN
ncbi:MAG: hypothetical protein VZS44_11940 [Bacilli bacterium]|nr:hypothetical protein [Bacilli bacterium]